MDPLIKGGETMKNLKLWGIVTTVAGVALSIASGVIADKKLDEKIQEQVQKAIKPKDE